MYGFNEWINPSMKVDICGVELKNPVIAASGTFGFGREYEEFYNIGCLGGISIKGITPKPKLGNPPPRVAETPSGMLNSVGLQNPGVDAFIENELPWLLEKNTAVIANISGNTEEDYCYMAERLANSGVHLLELNISCPNVKAGGIAFGKTPEAVRDITKAVTQHAKQPLIVKLSPNVADISDVAKAAEEGGADAVSLINTLTGMAVDVHKRKPILGNVTGGLSGPAVKPVALRMVYEAARAVSIPVIGMGGIMSGEDVVAFMLCGAKAVMVGTASIISPNACVEILMELSDYLRKYNIADVNDIVGKLEVL